MKYPALSEKRRGLSGTVLALILTAAISLAMLVTAVPVQAAKVDLTGRGVGYTAVLYDNSNGLPTSEANAIAQSDNGFVWIGSYSGLIRYDGNNFYRYPSTTGISSVVCLFIDSKDRIWIGTNDNGVAMLEDEKFTLFNSTDILSSASIRSIVEDENGDIIIGTTMGVGYIDENMELQHINEPQLNKEYICELVKSPDDNIIYGVTLSGVFFTMEDKRVTSFFNSSQMGYDKAYTIYPDPLHPGYVYIGTESDTIIYGDMAHGMSDVKILSCEPQNNVNSIRYIDGLLWVCTDNGIGFFNRNYRYTSLVDLPMTNSIDRIMCDYEGNLWFCSSRQGVMKVVANDFTDISKRIDMPPTVVNTTCMDGSDLYIGTDSGLYVIDKKYEYVQNAATELLEDVRIRCIRRDHDGRLWFCTYGGTGLVCYDPATDEYFSLTEEDGMASSRVRTMKVLSHGDLAVGTNGGMNIISNDAVTSKYDNKEGISNLEILCIEECSDGRLYLGSDGDGIYVVDGKSVSRIGLKDGLSSEVILRIVKDPKEELYWIITSNSIAYMVDDKVTTIRSFPYSNNFDMYFDNKDRIWVLSSNGVYVVKRDDMINDRISGETMEYTLYDTSCGLPSVATANSFSHLTDSGVLYISGSAGVSSIDINETTEDNKYIKLGVPYIMADDQYIAIHDQDEVVIPNDCRRLTIYSNAFTYSLNNPHMSYYLEGFDQDPIEVTKRDMEPATYTNLDGGTYKFHLAIINTMTGEADQSITLNIRKEKQIQEYPAFWGILFVLALAFVGEIISAFFRGKTKKLNAKMEERKSLINQMISVFAKCIDMKDRYTNGHSQRVAKYSAMFAERMGKSADEVEQIYNIALLHDIGKISIPDNILNKPGRLNDEEFAVMKSHSSNGRDILSEIKLDPMLAIGAGCHHERIDGSGYPIGLKGDEIPEIGQIIAVADTFDAMYSTRPYRKKLGLDVIVKEIKRCSGTQLSPKIVDIFLKLCEEGAFNAVEESAPAPVPETGSDAKPAEKAEEKTEEKKEAKAEAKSGEKAETKAEAKTEDKPEAKAETKAEEKPESKPEEKPDAKAGETPETKAEEKPAE